jgi:hypothetical protein
MPGKNILSNDTHDENMVTEPVCRFFYLPLKLVNTNIKTFNDDYPGIQTPIHWPDWGEVVDGCRGV